jgi:hypothetical protein
MKRQILAAGLVAAAPLALHEAGSAQMTQRDAREAEGRRICQTHQVTGKLAARRRICLTKAEWDRVAEEQRSSLSRNWLGGGSSCRNALCTDD